MTRWVAFAGVTLTLVMLLLALARATQAATVPARKRWIPPLDDGADHLDAVDSEAHPAAELPTVELLANVVLTQGLFGAVLVAGAWYAAVPPAALGVGGPAGPQLAVGVAFGLALAAVNIGAGIAVESAGLDPARELRQLLAPESVGGWAVLLGVVLPAIAAVEELLFRGALVGGFAAGFGISPWLLAALSSVAFALGHGAQGRLGVAVTGLFGFALAAGFVLTGSLLAVIVAHYLVNAAEFIVHES